MSYTNYTSYLDYVRVVVIRGLIHVQVRKLQWLVVALRRLEDSEDLHQPGERGELDVSKDVGRRV